MKEIEIKLQEQINKLNELLKDKKSSYFVNKNIKEKIKSIEKSLSNLNSEVDGVIKEINKAQEGALEEAFTYEPISNIPYWFSEKIYNKRVIIQEKYSKKKFEVLVSDICSKDFKGFIVDFSLEDTKRLKGMIKKYDIGKAIGINAGGFYQKKNKCLDLRTRFPHAKDWIYLGLVG